MSLAVRAGFDIDGVLAGFGNYAIRKLGLDPTLNTRWDFKHTYGEAVNLAVIQLIKTPTTWVEVEPLTGAREALDGLRSASVPFDFVSDFPQEFFFLRVWWLQHVLGAQYSEPFRLYRARGVEKVEFCRKLGTTHFLEDKLENAQLLAAAGFKSYIVPSTYMWEDGGAIEGIPIATPVEYAAAVIHDAGAAR